MIALPYKEREGWSAFVAGAKFASDFWGFAFCPYDFGSIEHASWINGYSAAWKSSVEQTVH